ncbi:hypothetical protein [Kitasatospora sp. NPDC054795]
MLKIPEAEVRTTNRSGKSSNYIVQLEFTDTSGTRVAEGAAATSNLAPNQAAVQKASGTAQVSGKVSCRIANVTRYAAPWVEGTTSPPAGRRRGRYLTPCPRA